MHIPDGLKRFKGESVLLIISGTQHAHVYHAHGSELESLQEIEVENPEYSDHEGFFGRRSTTGSESSMYGTGAVYESTDESTQEEFVQKLDNYLNHLQHDIPFDSVILFVPSHFEPYLTEHLPAGIRQNIKQVIQGNYVKQHPTDWLKHLD
jgi:hypothetical protein